MGVGVSTMYNRWIHPDVTPQPNTIPTFDPLYGFPEGRELKVMPVSQAEMESAKVPYVYRDYCVDKYIAFMECRAQNWPLVVRCHHQKHDYQTCQYHEYIDRMKDFERERRLMVRAKRIAEKASAA